MVLNTVFAVAVLGVTAITITDLVFSIGGERQPKEWAITKIWVCAPQTVLYHGLSFGFSYGDEERIAALTTLMGASTGAMTTSGIWSLADDIDPASLYGISWAIGANTAFTSMALGDLFGSRRRRMRALGIVEMASMVPTMAVSAFRLTDPTSSRPAWGALAGWSGLLFVHGLVATVVEKKRSGPTEPKEEKSAASQIQFGPTLVTDGSRRVPGLMIGGVF